MIKLSLSVILGVVLFSSLIYQSEGQESTGPQQFSLRVGSEPNILYIEGSGTYREGATVTTGKAPEQWMEYKFVGWKVDGQWYGGNPVTLRMDRSHQALAIYGINNVRVVMIDAVPRIAEITVDGRLYLPSELPLKLNWSERSIHAVAVNDIVQEKTGTRHIFDKWTDLSKETSRTMMVEQGDMNLRAIFKVQHYLKIISDYGKIDGSAWYDQGQAAEFSVSPTIVNDNTNDTGIRYVFDKWDNGDYRNSATNFMTIEEPATVRASWKEQYHLNLTSSAPGLEVAGSGWYDKGSTAYAGILQNEYDSGSPDTKIVFDKWVNRKYNPVLIQNPNSPVISLIMNDSYELEAQWKQSYYLNVVNPYGQAGGSGFYDRGAFADISVATQEIVKEKDKVRLKFESWDVGKAQVAGNVFSPNIKVRVDKPMIITAKWKQEYYLDVSSKHGSATGKGWYEVGEMVNISVSIPTSPTGLWVRHKFSGWTGDFSGKAESAKVRMNEPKKVKAEWSEDYSPAIVNSMIMGGVGVGGAIIYRRRKKKANGEIKPITLRDKMPLQFGEFRPQDVFRHGRNIFEQTRGIVQHAFPEKNKKLFTMKKIEKEQNKNDSARRIGLDLPGKDF